jgi:RIO-like serine/threonine protein kinase
MVRYRYKYTEPEGGIFTMNEGMGKERVVSFTEFLHELQKELKFHQNGGTSYRQKTAELSLEVANKVRAVAPFLEREVANKPFLVCFLVLTVIG